MAKKISEKTLKKSFRTWFLWNGCSQQAESMLGMAFGQAMAPVIEELYDTKEERAAALQRHITLFNTEADVYKRQEFDASHRAVAAIENCGLLTSEEVGSTKTVSYTHLFPDGDLRASTRSTRGSLRTITAI